MREAKPFVQNAHLDILNKTAGYAFGGLNTSDQHTPKDGATLDGT
jgi:hypothetical protein